MSYPLNWLREPVSFQLQHLTCEWSFLQLQPINCFLEDCVFNFGQIRLCDERTRTICTHASSIGPSITIQVTFMILGRKHDTYIWSIHKCKDLKLNNNKINNHVILQITYNSNYMIQVYKNSGELLLCDLLITSQNVYNFLLITLKL